MNNTNTSENCEQVSQEELDKIEKIVTYCFIAECYPPSCHVSYTIVYKDGSKQYHRTSYSNVEEANKYCEKKYPGIKIN